MSNLSTFTEVGLIDARASAGTLIVPSSTNIPGRIITFKDIYGAVGNSTIALLTSTGDVFEDGTNYRTLTNPFDFITLYAGSTNVWYTVGGTQYNAMRANIMSNSAFTTSSITTNTINAGFNYSANLYPQVGGTFTQTSNLLPIVNATTSGISIGNITSNYFQIFSQSTLTSNITAGISVTSTIYVGNSLTPAYSTFRFSTISLGNPTNCWFQGYFVSTITSSINADIGSFVNVSTQSITGFSLLGTTILSTQQILCSSIQIGAGDSILDVLGPLRTQDLSTFTLEASTITNNTIVTNQILGGPLLTATTTGNLYPFSAGATIGFGATIGSNGFYAQGTFRSTFTQVIQPTLDNNTFSNIVFINGNISSQNIIVSSITTSYLNSSNNSIYSPNFYPQGVNILGYGTGGPGNGPWDSASIRYTQTSSIITNNISSGNIFASTFNTNYLSSGNAFISSLTMNGFTVGTTVGYVNIPFIQSVLLSSIQTNTTILNASNTTISTVNRKLNAYTSTFMNVPYSSFLLSGANASNITAPLILYSSFTFPHAGYWSISQRAIFSRPTGTVNVPQASILYPVGIYPSTTTNVDGYASLPSLMSASASTFVTLTTSFYVSSTQLSRNIIYQDATGNTYTANLYLAPLNAQYTPNNTLNPE